MATEAPITRSRCWFKGEDKILQWTLDPVEDISGWTIKFAMATERNNGALLLEKACTVIDGPSGVYSVLIADTDTDNLESLVYFYETKRVDAGSEAILAFGQAELLQPVGIE